MPNNPPISRPLYISQRTDVDVAAHTCIHFRYFIDEVCIVVLSEMGRTPYQNGGKGKDHWQHTSAMPMGSGIRGGKPAGSSLFYGQPIDLQSGDVTFSGQDISTRLLGHPLALGMSEMNSPHLETLFGFTRLKGVK